MCWFAVFNSVGFMASFIEVFPIEMLVICMLQWLVLDRLYCDALMGLLWLLRIAAFGLMDLFEFVDFGVLFGLNMFYCCLCIDIVTGI